MLWANRSKRPPPALLLTALGCRPYLKLPNLFLPCGLRLTPPPRRDILRGLAPDAGQLTILLPLGAGGWTPVRVAEEAFVALEECVEYVAEPRRQTLAFSSPRHGLDWESFEEHVVPPRPQLEVRPPTPALEKTPAKPQPVSASWLERVQQKLFATKKPLPAAKIKVGDAVRRALPDDAAPPPPAARPPARSARTPDSARSALFCKRSSAATLTTDCCRNWPACMPSWAIRPMRPSAGSMRCGTTTIRRTTGCGAGCKPRKSSVESCSVKTTCRNCWA